VKERIRCLITTTNYILYHHKIYILVLLAILYIGGNGYEI